MNHTQSKIAEALESALSVMNEWQVGESVRRQASEALAEYQAGEKAEPIAWAKKNDEGRLITITQEHLDALSPKWLWVAAFWKDAEPLYAGPHPASDRKPLTEAQEREAFEKWIAKDCGDLTTFGAGQNVHYRNSAVNNAWTGWKARAHGINPPKEGT